MTEYTLKSLHTITLSTNELRTAFFKTPISSSDKPVFRIRSNVGVRRIFLQSANWAKRSKIYYIKLTITKTELLSTAIIFNSNPHSVHNTKSCFFSMTICNSKVSYLIDIVFCPFRACRPLKENAHKKGTHT